MSFLSLLNNIKDPSVRKIHTSTDIALATYLSNSHNNSTSKGIHNIRNQSELRDFIIKRDKKCVVTGHNPDECEVAHLKPFKDCSTTEQFNPDNAILLSANLHKIFDMYKWTITPDTYQIISSSNSSIKSYENKVIKLPITVKPFLHARYTLFKQHFVNCRTHTK
jgi:hypothetical protein